MRFLADGPSIPDELLLARDQGRVIFFCGSGVSRAKAKLPDFFELAKRVISRLGVEDTSPAYRLINEAKEIDRRVGVSGIISADRIFGLLEREFQSKDIERAVALSLKPQGSCDLSAHRALIDLATSPEGNTLLVTTNFDRLFDKSNPSIKSWQPPKLPDPSNISEMNGIVYLHGKANERYNGSETEPFILSSSEFGRAYLADGWATKFFSEIIKKYNVVFIGYSADDPPIQYLLEALNKAKQQIHGAYAFQSGREDHAASLWSHKGVSAIPYSANNDHSALWETIEAWSNRASNVGKWHDDLINLALKGPTSLQPHERGQVAHIVSTYEGAKKFANRKNPPPAEWLCVFDKHRRYAKPSHSMAFLNMEKEPDPFELYHIDSDIRPQASLEEEYPPQARSELLESWDAFEVNQFDQASIYPANGSALFGHGSNPPLSLAPRLNILGDWISEKCSDPIAAWWAAGKGGLHIDVVQKILWAMGREEYEISPPLRKAWKMMFHAQNRPPYDPGQGYFTQESIVKLGGWDNWSLDELSRTFQPRLTVAPSTARGPLPPLFGPATSIHDIIRPDVIYYKPNIELDIPVDYLPAFVAKIRKHIEYAIELETEIEGHGLHNIDSLEGDDSEAGSDSIKYEYGISIIIKIFADLFVKLVVHNPELALEELQSWPGNEANVFARMRIYASNIKSLISPHLFFKIISKLSREEFWGQQHQRDLLLSLSRRWNELNLSQKRCLEKKILLGPISWEGERPDEYAARRSRWALNKIHWLSRKGAEYTFEISEVTEELKGNAPDWTIEQALSLADSLHGKGGIVRTDPDYSALNDVPISAILPRSYAIKKIRADFLIKTDPFLGLSKERPMRAFRALIRASQFGIYLKWAWQTFLSAQIRNDDSNKLKIILAKRLSTLDSKFFSKIGGPFSSWLMASASGISRGSVETFEALVEKQVSAIVEHPEIGVTSISTNAKDIDWPMISLNSMTGQLARALFDDVRFGEIKSGATLPSSWKALAESLLSIPGDPGIYAYVIFSKSVDWLHAIDPIWTMRNIISLRQNSTHRDAFFAAFLWSAKIPNISLYKELKADLLALSRELKGHKSSYFGVLSGILMAGWVTTDANTGERVVSNEEMRSALLNSEEEFRVKAIWKAGNWAKSNKNSNPWRDQSVTFFREVWPKQTSAKSGKISSRLLDMVFSSESNFNAMANAVLPLLTKSDGSHLSFTHRLGEDGNAFQLNPALALELLHRTLPDDAINWPYGIERVLEAIEESDSSQSQSPKLISLKRRWQDR